MNYFHPPMMINHQTQVEITDCIAFKKGSYDSNAAWDGHDFIIPISTLYIFKNELGKYQRSILWAGSKKQTDEILSSNCGVFYKALERKIR